MNQWTQQGQQKPDHSKHETPLPQPRLRLPSRQQAQPSQQFQWQPLKSTQSTHPENPQFQWQPERSSQSTQPDSSQFQWQRQRLPLTPQQLEQLRQLQLKQQSQLLQQQKQHSMQPKTPPKKQSFLRKKVEIPIWAILVFILLVIVALPTVTHGNLLGRSITGIAPSASGSTGSNGISSPTSVSSPTSSTNQTSSLLPGSKPTAVPTAHSTAISTPTVVSQVGDTVISGNVACTFVSMKPLNGDGFIMPQAGNEFIIVRVEITNHDSSVYVYSPINFEVLSGSGNYIYEEYGPSSYTGNMRLEAGKLATGIHVEGDVIFEVPIGDHKATLIWFPDFVTKVNGKSWLLEL